MYIADLHIHSHYSRATSRELTPQHLDLWARKKGIHIVGTGDFTHPGWREELLEKLTPAEEGLYVLKQEYVLEEAGKYSSLQPRFVITGELSSIYKKHDKTRKVHSVLLLPGLEEAEVLARKLETIGNIHSDGRPILGLDCHDLLEIMLELTPQSVYIPAHIWTPHFSLLGAFSGFDTIEECYEDLTPYIHALETGLSSDPPMNWRLKALDRYNLVSNSDAHSPSKLGREANLLDCELSYSGLTNAIQKGSGLKGTIEFFPEEGKYHYDGHRKCHLCLSPSEADRYKGICPVCGKKLTTGVSHRVEQLADRREGDIPEGRKPYESLVPLPEVIAASTGNPVAGKKVQAQYENMLRTIGNEFMILREALIEEIRSKAGSLVAEGIARLRAGKVERVPGYDGEYGIIRLFEQWEIDELEGQMSLFNGVQLEALVKEERARKKAELEQKLERSAKEMAGEQAQADEEEKKTDSDAGNQAALNMQQEQAVKTVSGAVAVIAGPGTGKTKTLVARVLHLIKDRRVSPSEITALTFTNKAAKEMQSRLKQELGGKRRLGNMRIGTFHAVCTQLLKEAKKEFMIADEMETIEFARDILKEHGMNIAPAKFLGELSLWKNGLPGCMEFNNDENFRKAAEEYQGILRRSGILDYDDLLLEVLSILENEDAKKLCGGKFNYLLVDEYQDISPVQYRLIRAFAGYGREMFVIGDPDQSIYGFRGSDARCFEKLRQNYPKLEIIRLEHNYRSTPEIVHSASAVISHNEGQKHIARPVRESGLPVRIVSAVSERSEAIFVAKEINRMIGGIDMLEAQEKGYESRKEQRRGFSDIAVLYRTHRQAALLEECLKTEGIPYVTAGREDFLGEPEVRGTICFFRYLMDRQDKAARETCLRLLFDVPGNEISYSVFETLAEKYKTALRQKSARLLTSWADDMSLNGHKAMQKLIDVSVCYSKIQEMLDCLAFGTEGDLYRCGGRSYTSDAVTLMTLHGSKGLEFPSVILYGARKGLMPLEHGKLPADTMEERRLFFVGMTRAKEELIITTSGEPSMFLGELPGEYLVREKASRWSKKEEAVQMSLFDL